MGTGENSNSGRPHWGSSLAFVIAAAGSAIGLGNIWKFPYITGVYGGGAFVLIYLVTIAAVGLPLMVAEIMIGKHTQRSPASAIRMLRGSGSPWMIVGVLSIVAAFVILSYYSVVAGWTLHYLFLSLKADFAGKDPDTIYQMFADLYVNGPLNVFWHFVMMIFTTLIVYRGIKGGIERSTKILMPALLGILIILLMNSMFSEGAGPGLRFLFSPDFSKLSPKAVLEAVGHGFFTLSLGMGAMITYGSYLKKEGDIARPAMAIVAFDTVIALLAGMVIFPIVFAYGFEPGAGPGLVFRTLPVVFSRMPGGTFMAILFFLLLFLAALTSAISLLEVVISYLVDSGKLKRHQAAIVSGAAIFSLGILSALSGGPFSHIKVPFIGKNLFDSFDYLATNWILPLGGILIATFTGWALPDDIRKVEFLQNAPWWWHYKLWLFSIRWVTPIGVLLVFLHLIGVLEPVIGYLFYLFRLIVS